MLAAYGDAGSGASDSSLGDSGRSPYALLLAAYVATLFLLARKGAKPQTIETGPTSHPNAFVAAE